MIQYLTVLLMLYTSSVNNAESNLLLENPSQVISITLPDFPIFDPLADASGIFILKINRENSVISIDCAKLDRLFGSDQDKIIVLNQKKVLWNLLTNQQIDQNIGDLHFENSTGIPVVYDASSVVVHGKQIPLQDAYHYTNEDGQTSFSLESPILSFDEQKVGGIVRAHGFESRISWSFYVVALWDVINGKLIWYEDPTGQHVKYDIPGRRDSPVIETRFSMDSRFFLARGITSFIYDESTQRYLAFLPETTLVDTKTLQQWSADKDVAFTSDSKFFVTERDGIPSLVNAFTGSVIQRYDTGSPMTAATFSPDDKKLYIAAIDNKIYVFDSNLPSSSAQAWEEYRK